MNQEIVNTIVAFTPVYSINSTIPFKNKKLQGFNPYFSTNFVCNRHANSTNSIRSQSNMLISTCKTSQNNRSYLQSQPAVNVFRKNRIQKVAFYLDKIIHNFKKLVIRFLHYSLERFNKPKVQIKIEEEQQRDYKNETISPLFESIYFHVGPSSSVLTNKLQSMNYKVQSKVKETTIISAPSHNTLPRWVTVNSTPHGIKILDYLRKKHEKRRYHWFNHKLFEEDVRYSLKQGKFLVLSSFLFLK